MGVPGGCKEIRREGKSWADGGYVYRYENYCERDTRTCVQRRSVGKSLLGLIRRDQGWPRLEL